MYLILHKTNSNCSVASNLLSANALNSDQSKVFLFGKESSNFNFPAVKVFNFDRSKALFFDKRVNPLPNNKILDQSKLKAFADDKINSTEKSKLVLRRVENFVGKGENAEYQHFLLFPQCFQKPSHSRSLKVGTVWSRVNPIPLNCSIPSFNNLDKKKTTF